MVRIGDISDTAGHAKCEVPDVISIQVSTGVSVTPSTPKIRR